MGGLEIITLPTGVVETKRYVGDAVLTTRSNSTSREAYVLRDHLGSPNLIVDQNGQVLQNQRFDAFGQRRDNLTWLPLTGTSLTAFDTSITKRGYPGHEGIDAPVRDSLIGA